RMELSEDLRLLEWLTQIQQRQIQAQPYEFAPLVKIQSWSEVAPGSPLFESIFVFENYPVEKSLKEESFKDEGQAYVFERANYPLAIVAGLSSELLLKVSYSSDRIRPEIANRLLGRLKRLLESFIENPHSLLSQVELLSKTEREQLLVEWNNTAREYP